MDSEKIVCHLLRPVDYWSYMETKIDKLENNENKI
jgi:hypothetical protein